MATAFPGSPLRPSGARLGRIAERVLPGAIIGASFLFLLLFSWCRWGDLFVDNFEQQWMFRELAAGKVLYRDVFCQYGFLPFYLVAFLERIFGVTLSVSVGVGIAVTALFCWVGYRLARLHLSRAFSTLFVVTFLFVVAFNGVLRFSTFILPANLANTFVALFVNAALYAFSLHFRTGRRRFLWGWAALMFLAFLSRIFIALGAWMLFVAVGLYGMSVTRGTRPRWPALVAPVLLAIASYLAFLWVADAWLPFYRSAIQRFLLFSGGQDPMGTARMGTFVFEENGSRTFVLPGNLLRMGTGAVVTLLVVGLFHIAAKAIPRLPGARSRSGAGAVLVAMALAGLVTAGGVLAFLPEPRDALYVSLPLLLALGSVVVVARGRRSNPIDALPTLALFAASGAMVARSVFHLTLHDNTTAMLPGLLAWFVLLVEVLPSLLRDRFPGAHRRLYAAMVAVLVVGANAPAAARVVQDYRQKDWEHETARGTIGTTRDDRSVVFWELVDFLRSGTPAGSTVVVFPEGAGINFFADRDNPLWTVNYVPTHIEMVSEPGIIGALEARSIDYVVLVNTRLWPYGHDRFGVDFGVEIANWIAERYQPIQAFGASPGSEECRAVVLKRKSAPPPSPGGS